MAIFASYILAGVVDLPIMFSSRWAESFLQLDAARASVVPAPKDIDTETDVLKLRTTAGMPA